MYKYFSASSRSLVQSIPTECVPSEYDLKVWQGDVTTQRQAKAQQEIKRQKEDSYIL
jgi:hypothetical protein